MDLDFGPLLESWRYIAGGVGVTILLSALTALLSAALGGALGLGRVYGPWWLRARCVLFSGPASLR